MGKNQNTFEKMRREMEKKRKANEKRARREQRKEEPQEATEFDDPRFMDGAAPPTE